MRLFIITGYSGAGKSVALKAFEDAGVACMDNLPLSAVSDVLASVEGTLDCLAMCLDVRSHGFESEPFLALLESLREKYQLTLIFLTCHHDTLIARYNATKHRHPLFQGDSIPESLKREEALLVPVRAQAETVLDTSRLTPHQLKQHLQSMVGHAASGLSVQVMSFSYQFGLPENADLVFDVRCLQNPHYDEALRPLTGKDAEVAAFIEEDAHSKAYLEHLQTLLGFLIPLYVREGKSYLTLAIGCTGGRHRSVYMTERLAPLLPSEGISVTIRHRELDH